MFGTPINHHLRDYMNDPNYPQDIDHADFVDIKSTSGSYTAAVMAQGGIPFTHAETSMPLQSTQTSGANLFSWTPQQVPQGYGYQLPSAVDYNPYTQVNPSQAGYTGPRPSIVPKNTVPNVPFLKRKRSRGSTTSQIQRPMPAPKQRKVATAQGPQHNRNTRVQKNSPSLHPLIMVGPTGRIGQKWYEFMALKGLYRDDQPCEVMFEDMRDFFRRLDDENGQSMAHELTAAQSRQHQGTPLASDIPSPSTMNYDRIKHDIAKQFRGYQKEFRLNEGDTEGKYKCTLGCLWSHGMKSNWERHERTHYPQEIWICCQPSCMNEGVKRRVSFRKDLARRHYQAHHKVEGEECMLSDKQLEELVVQVPDSLFPKTCVFAGCTKQFSSWEERSTHTERHLKKADFLVRESILKYTVDRNVTQEPEGEPDNEIDEETKQQFHQQDYDVDDQEGNDGNGDEDENDDDEDEDDDDGDADDQAGFGIRKHDRDDGAGASGPTGNMPSLYGSTKGIGHWATSGADQMGFYGVPYDSKNYTSANGFVKFGGTNYISPVDERPWKSLMSLRLQLLPQLFARGIAQTPLVLKKIQLQAALAMEASSVKKIQMIKILRREIAVMAAALPLSPGPRIQGFPRSTAMTKLLPSLRNALPRYSKPTVSKQDKIIRRFSGDEEELFSEKNDILEEYIDDTKDAHCSPFCSFDGGQIYQCLRVQPSKSPIRPSRLIHVGSNKKPMLHLDTSEVLPSQVSYCSLSHCWDDGHALSLSTANMASLRQEIPADGLTQSFHLAINIARDKGVEYVWIDTLCIMQDSHEDLIFEASRITQIHESATFSIVITSVAFDKELQVSKEIIEEPESYEEVRSKSFYHSRRLTGDSISTIASDVPELTIGLSAADTESTKPTTFAQSESHNAAEIKEEGLTNPQRRGSHQLESFLAEPPKKSFFLPLSPFARDSSSTPMSLPIRTKPNNTLKTTDPPISASPSPTYRSPPKISTYLDKWHSNWQRLCTRSEATSPITSRSPSISDISFRSEKKKGVLSFPAAWEKLLQGLRKKDISEFEIGCDAGNPDG